MPDEICGVVISIRYSEDILGIWNKTAEREVIGLLRDAIKKILQLPPQASMEYKPHQTSIQDKSSFRNTQVRHAIQYNKKYSDWSRLLWLSFVESSCRGIPTNFQFVF